MPTMTPVSSQPRQFSYRHSLAIRLSLVIMVMSLVVFGMLSATFALFEHDKIKHDIDRNGETFATFSAPTIYENYSQFYTHPEASDFEHFRQNVSDILSHNQDIKQIKLVSLNGRILFSSEEFGAGKYSGSTFRTVNDQLVLDAVAKDNVSKWSAPYVDKQATTIVVPLRETGGGHFLSMLYVLSYDSLTNQLSSSLQRLGWILLGLFVLVSVVTFGVSLGIVRPIIRLTRVAERLRNGDFTARAHNTNDDEIGRLAQTLNSMADQINANVIKIEDQNRILRLDKVQLQASINSLDVGFIMTDASNNVVMLNPEAERILSYTVNAEGISKPEAIRHDWSADTIAQKLGTDFAFIKALDDSRVPGGGTVQRKEISFNGRMLRIFVAPIIDSDNDGKQQVLGTVILLTDVTEQIVLQRSKDEFFSIASHELRTPLTAIRGNASMIQTYYSDHLKDNSLKELVDDIHESSVRLIAIVSDFLDVTRAEQGKMHYELEAIALDKVIENVIYETSASYREKDITIKFDTMRLGELPQGYADKNRVKQIVYNLVDNAAKFTPPNGTVAVSIEQHKHVLKVYVKDSGPGIEPEAQRLLFHKFQQAGYSLYTRKTERGTGLGLYICKLMVEQMGGTIKIESSIKGEGTTFSFTVPVFAGQKSKTVDEISPTAPTPAR